ARARASRKRQIGHMHAQLGVEWATESADTRTVTATRVAADRDAAVNEGTASLVHDLAVRSHDVRADRRDVEHLLHLIEEGCHLIAIDAPRIEHEIRCAKACAGVDQRGPADAAADREGDRRHADREGQPVATIKAAQPFWR